MAGALPPPCAGSWAPGWSSVGRGLGICSHSKNWNAARGAGSFQDVFHHLQKQGLSKAGAEGTTGLGSCEGPAGLKCRGPQLLDEQEGMGLSLATGSQEGQDAWEAQKTAARGPAGPHLTPTRSQAQGPAPAVLGQRGPGASSWG